MKIQCKNCGVYFSIDQQNCLDHPYLCDKCLNSLPKKAEYKTDEFESKKEVKVQKKESKKEVEDLDSIPESISEK